MITEPVLTESEWMLLVELLERERGQLPVEIHHSDVPDAKAHLKQRLRPFLSNGISRPTCCVSVMAEQAPWQL